MTADATALLLPETMFLLLVDPVTGKKSVGDLELDYALAGAAFAELAESGHLRVSEPGESDVKKNRLVLDDDLAPPNDPLLASALTRAVSKKPKPPEQLVDQVSKGMRKEVITRLVRSEIRGRSARKVLGLFPVDDYPAVTGDVDRQLRANLDEVLFGGVTPSAKQAAVIGLLVASGALVKVADQGRGVDKKATEAFGKPYVAEQWPAQATQAAIQAFYAAGAAGAAAAAAG